MEGCSHLRQPNLMITGSAFSTGSQQDGGIMPRCIDVIFNSIVNFQARRFVFKPDRLNSFDVQTEADAMLDRQREILSTPKPGKTPRKKWVQTSGGRSLSCVAE